MRAILKRHRKVFRGDEMPHLLPPEAWFVTSMRQQTHRVAPKIDWTTRCSQEPLKKLLENKLIEHSESQWASPIMIVLKKMGWTSGFLPSYPLSLVDDLRIGFEKALSFVSLNMASGFWAIKMTERVKLIAPFVCPFRQFQWIRMRFGLQNALLIYQQVINNWLWGFVRLPPEAEAEVDQEVLNYLNLDAQDDGPPGYSTPGCTGCEDDHTSRSLPTLADQITVFKRNIPAPTQMSPVLGRSSYIDDIAHGAPTWDALCADLDALLYRLRYWNISVSLPKSEFGKLTIPCLSHEISAEGIRAPPKIAKGVQDLSFPTTMKGVRSFLGSLNYYHKFIEDYPVIAASLVKQAVEILKHNIVSTPVLKHPDRTIPFVIIPHANRWAACAVLGQAHDGLIQPVRFTGRVLHQAELRYHIAEKKFIDVLRVPRVFRTLIQGCPLITLSPEVDHEIQDGRREMRTLGWQWNLDVRKIQRDEHRLAAILRAGITPREHLDEVDELIPAKGCAKPPPIISVEMLKDSFEGIVLSFDGAAKTSSRQDAQGFILDDVTVNDAEYCGLLNGLIMAQARGRLIAVGDSRIVIQQVQGRINCNQPNSQRRLTSCEALKAKFDLVRLVHVKRDFNQTADFLTSRTLLLGRSWSVQEDGERQHMERVSKIQEKLMKSAEGHVVTGHSGSVVPQEEEGRSDIPGCPSALDVMAAPLPRAAKILVAVTRASVRDQRCHLNLSILRIINERGGGELRYTKSKMNIGIAKVAGLFALDARGVLYRWAQSTRGRPRDAQDELRLVVPVTLREDILHYAHEDFQGGHQGIKRTHEKFTDPGCMPTWNGA
ncbi:LOW QUALITY PROTEIN: reverse transcriptase [Phytophthora megakarya]|uniref:Reverse transcriptase n=1 Tax=Phytophthora megakarya TaxID=4795 RepID=A0A225WQ29_9STRA|nr:LOW QUALITY PROTEIN: reverse transcriptase [Phytophthora megakarya]